MSMPFFQTDLSIWNLCVGVYSWVNFDCFSTAQSVEVGVRVLKSQGGYLIPFFNTFHHWYYCVTRLLQDQDAFIPVTEVTLAKPQE